MRGKSAKSSKSRARLKGPIHARIARLREEHGLTQEELAAEIGVDKTAVSHWETAIARPDLARLPKLAAVFGISIEELIEGEKAA